MALSPDIDTYEPDPAPKEPEPVDFGSLTIDEIARITGGEIKRAIMVTVVEFPQSNAQLIFDSLSGPAIMFYPYPGREIDAPKPTITLYEPTALVEETRMTIVQPALRSKFGEAGTISGFVLDQKTGLTFFSQPFEESLPSLQQAALLATERYLFRGGERRDTSRLFEGD